MKAIHNSNVSRRISFNVVLYPKDTEKWKQFTTFQVKCIFLGKLFCIPKILKNESNSQLHLNTPGCIKSCFVSQRYWKMKAIHNCICGIVIIHPVVLYPKDTEKWKQFTTYKHQQNSILMLFCIPKILKNESNSQHRHKRHTTPVSCFVSQRYWKMKAIHNWVYLP